MNRKKSMRMRALAGALTMALVSAGTVMVVISAQPDPGIHLKGLELKMMTDPVTNKQTAQALVEVSVTNQSFLQGVNVTLDYNEDYLVPSDWVTNIPFDKGLTSNGRNEDGDVYSGVQVIDYADPLHHLFFHTDENLYKETYSNSTVRVDPLKFWKNEKTDGSLSMAGVETVDGLLEVNRANVNSGTTNRVHFNIGIRDMNDLPLKEGSGLVKKTASSNNNDYYYFENEASDENEVILGTLSFRVNENIVEGTTSVEDLEKKLREMVSKFDGLHWEYDKDPTSTTDPSKDSTGKDKEFLLRVTREDRPGSGTTLPRFRRFIKNLIETDRRGYITYQKQDNNSNTGIDIDINADDVIQKVWPVKDEITINSYQAFTNGDVGDLAITMQNYAESVRVKRVSGKEQDMSIYWGDPVNNPASGNMPKDGPGMFIYKAKLDTTTGEWIKDTSEPRYRFKWTAAGYTVEREDSTGFTAVNSADIYGCGKLFDPRGDYLHDGQYGNYIIEQYFTYWEATGSGGTGALALKTFPKAVSVTVHVTPIKVIDASVEKRQITYRNDIDEVPQTFARLDLADDAKLTLDTTINGLTPTMPVSWTPKDSPAWVSGTLDDRVLGVPGAHNPNISKPTPDNVAKWPIGAAAIDDKEGIGTYTFETQVLQAKVQTKFPWVTVDKDYPLDSIRHIVYVEPAKPDEPNAQLPRYVMWAEPYEVITGDTVASLRITIARQEATWNATTEAWDWAYVNMDPAGPVDYDFKLYMPNDQQIMAEPGIGGVNWFNVTTPPTAAFQPSYTVSHRTGINDADKGFTNLSIYEFNICPGDLNLGDGYAAQREILRRYINLGGWFGAEILEPGGDPSKVEDWEDKITGFSKPRTNIHIMSYILDPAASPTPVPTGTETWLFDYTGNRAGLMPFYANDSLPKFITLPADETVEVRYDGTTGAQPGEMRQFQVESWTNVSKTTVTTPTPPAVSPSPAVTITTATYGADLFAREHDYGDFGTVNNPDTATLTGYPANLKDRKVKIKVQEQDPQPMPSDKPESWDLTLTYEQTGDNVTEYTDGQVKRVTFDNKQEGFTYQQIVTLTLTNKGNRDIRGLHIEIPDTPNGPCFRLVTPPPEMLPAGASATFQLSYILNLPEGTYENIFTTKPTPNPIHIWHDNSGPQKDGTQPVTLTGHTDEGFEAVLKVTKTKPNKVTVVIHPTIDDDGAETKPMGDGWLVEGVTTASGADKYSDTLGSNVYEEKDRFWVLTQPKDEYSLITTKDSGATHVWVYYIRDDDATQTKVYLNEYKAGGGNTGFGTVDKSFVTQDNPERLFWGEMPDCSVTVHVHYYEPLLSKLRLSDLHAYAWDQKDEIKLKDPPEAAAWKEMDGISSDPNDPNSYLTNSDAYERPLNVHNGGNDYEQILFDPVKDEYIVFLDRASAGTDNLCGVSIQLRNLVTHINGIGDTANPLERNNVDIYPNVMMTLDDADHTIVCNDVPVTTPPVPPATDPTITGPNTGIYTPAVGATPSTYTSPTCHHSAPFNAPVDDPSQTSIAQTTVTITISYDGTALVPPEGYESRTYKVRFVREMEKGKAKHVALAGNSPYGMIENDDDIFNKAAAKATFDVNNRFDFSNTAHTPKQASALKNIYWPEAWGDGVNYDKNIEVLFVYAGQEFYDPGVKNIYNNAGDYIDGIEVSRSLEYVQMDISQTTPYDRFNVDPTTSVATIDFGPVPAVNGVIPGDTMTLTADDGTTTNYDGMIDELVGVADIRPGIYQMKYTYMDHDKTTPLYFTRPVIVLSPNGDVDANWVQNGAGSKTVEDQDAVAIRKRFNTGWALPYELPDNVYTDADKLVYKYRIVDANNDRNINNIDAGLIRKVTTLFTGQELTQFYRPTEYTNPIKP